MYSRVIVSVAFIASSRISLVTTMAIMVGALAACVPSVRAQDIEPRAYSNAPVGVNFLIAGYALRAGGSRSIRRYR